MPWYIPTLILGIHLEKYNPSIYKSSNRAARIISDMSNDTHHSIALRTLGFEPLDIMRKKAKARIMYKTLNKIAPKSLTNYSL